ncbi:DUF4926 domain-containing protein [Amycolatopsis sp. NBC_01480]|uniref:DUF4926 domain-containing protein n=1 Tax=Amycolatopsis sp. NBC_01480 TaxID=2903562 RepID=UPI002E2DE287|nr:DUF4926 domain-containing protein [Amycolatopsis sp. NBC_01480]
MIEQYAKVRILTNRFHADGVRAGDTGYAIECYPKGRYEVEISKSDGVTIAQFVAEEAELQQNDHRTPKKDRK